MNSKIIADGRGTGKTTQLIRQSAATGFYIVTNSQSSASLIVRMAKDLHLDIPFPLTYDEFLRRGYSSKGVRGLLFDDVDMFVQRLASVLIHTMTINVGPDEVRAELAMVERFYQRVCARAEATIERTHQIAGAHYAAMQVELEALRNAARVATESLVHWPQIEPAADQARAVTPLEQEIAWHQTHHGKSGHGADFETGFIAGLQHALAVEQQALSVLLDVAAGELLDRDELIATLRLWQGGRDE